MEGRVKKKKVKVRKSIQIISPGGEGVPLRTSRRGSAAISVVKKTGRNLILGEKKRVHTKKGFLVGTGGAGRCEFYAPHFQNEGGASTCARTQVEERVSKEPQKGKEQGLVEVWLQHP